MATHSRSHSQPIQYRYRPNGPASTTGLSSSIQKLEYQSPPPSRSGYSTLQLTNTPLCNPKQDFPLSRDYLQATSDTNSLNEAVFPADFDHMNQSGFILANSFQPVEFQTLASPQISPWISSNSSVTSDTCSGAWSSPTSTMSFSPEPQFQIPYMEASSWPTQNPNSYFPANCISMQEVFPASAVETEYAAPPVYLHQIAQPWQSQYMGNGFPQVYESSEYSSSHASPRTFSEQARRSSETVATVSPRPNSLMGDASDVSSPRFSNEKAKSMSPQAHTKSPYEGQLLEFSTPVAQAKSKGPKSAALPCPLAAYGCTSSFISKNEWKRHINTQHLRLEAWLCDQCPKRESKREFNRKDLFIQHLKRMHPSPCSTHSPKSQPVKSKSGRSAPKSDKATKSSKGEDIDPALLVAEQRCHITLRQPPADSACLFCSTNFSGRGSWEARIEHVAKHMEQYKKEGSEVPDPKTWRADRALEQWLVSEGVITKSRQRWSIV